MRAREAIAPAAAAFLQTIADRRVPYLFERSRKFVRGIVDTHRFLATIAVSDLGDAFDEWLLEHVVRPDSPCEWRARIRVASKGCVALHLGFEAAGDAAGYKLYFEYPLRESADVSSRGLSPSLVHRAFKWRAGCADAPAEALYTWHADPERSVAQQVEHLFATEAPAAPAARIGRAICALVASRAPGIVPTMLEVREIGSPRRSYDLQFYDAGLRVSDAVSLLRREAEALGLRPDDVFAALAPVEGARLGHVAAGRDRADAVFATLYFGPQRR